MSLITRCPACRTMFKVVPDQLRISEGWVRCGQCEEVFDAESHLVSGRVTSPGELGGTAPRAQEAAPQPAEASAQATETSATTKHETQVRLLAEDRVLESEFPETEDYALDDRPDTTAEDTVATPSFLRANNAQRSRHSSMLVRVMLGGLATCLGLVLMAQVLWQERERIVTYEPVLKPWLQALCDELGCTIEPLRQIESIVIDSTAFNKVRDEVYRFNLTIKNTAPIELATPAIELSLTDIADQPVMRRVFLPQELGLDRKAMQPMSEGSASLSLSIKTRDASERIAGYRVLAFYP